MTTFVILMLTILSPNGTLSARQQRMTLAECHYEMNHAKAEAKLNSEIVFGGCVPTPNRSK